MTDAAAYLEQLLVETAAAHGRYEEEVLGGVHHEEWPEWYASYMAKALAERGVELVEERRPEGDASRNLATT